MTHIKAALMNFLNALERIPKLVEQYKEQNVTYERDIPQETVDGIRNKEDELKALKAEVAAHDETIEILQNKIPHPQKTKKIGYKF